MMDPFVPWVVALTHSGFGGGLPLSGRDWWPLFEPPPMSPIEIDGRVQRASNPAMAQTFARREALLPELEQLEAEGVVGLTMFDRAFPTLWAQRLGPRVPPVVFLLGDAEILKSKAVAIVGSRDADESALDFTAEMAQMAAADGLAVVTGGASGVDRAAIAAATRAGGTAIVITADSFAEVQSKLLRAEVDLDQVLLVTPSHPNSGWSVGKAMGRNKLVYALAKVAVVAACEANTGGTWTGATEAIKMDYCPVCIWTGKGSSPGNRSLETEGAFGIERPETALAPLHEDCPRPQSAFDL